MARPNPKRFSLQLDIESARMSKAGGDASLLFHDVLKRMDGVVGYGPSDVSTFGHESSTSKIASLCEELKNIMLSTHPNGTDPRLEIPTETRDTLVTWLLGDPRGSPFTKQLQKDREVLMKQVQMLERKLEVCQSENDSLKTSMIEMQRRVAGSHSDLRPLSGQARTNSTGALPYSDDMKQQQQPVSMIQAGSSSASLPHHYHKSSSSASVGSGGNFKRQRSFRESFRKAFTRNKKSLGDMGQNTDGSLKPLNARAQHFHSLNGPDLADWMGSIGLEMYGELISQLVGTGERLASIAANTEDMMRLGVLNILHCKKVKLAVEDAIAETPGPLSKLDHRWVTDWLQDVGLPQYQQPFMDARIDANMLNSLSMEDLDFLKIDHPFHITSLRRAIQAFRMCGFDPNYFKIGPEKGSHKLLNWSVYHIIDWLRDIELDEYAGNLQGTGVNGPVVALEPTLTHESIAKAIGITPNKGLIVTHLGEKFAGIIGPIFAQKKVDVMNQKHFAPLDITVESSKGKSRSKGAKKSKQGQQGEETYLCPPNEILAPIPRPFRGVVIRGGSAKIGTATSNKSVTETWCNSTVSSGAGRRSLVCSPSPQDQFLTRSSPPLPPATAKNSSALNLTQPGSNPIFVAASSVTPVPHSNPPLYHVASAPPLPLPPPPPPPPPMTNGY